MYYYGSVALLLYNQYHYPEPYLYSRPIYIFSCCVALSVFHQYVRITKIIIIMFSIIYAYHYYFTTIIDPPPHPIPVIYCSLLARNVPRVFTVTLQFRVIPNVPTGCRILSHALLDIIVSMVQSLLTSIRAQLEHSTI